MAITDAQLIQIENEALSLNARTDRITAQVNSYVATVNAAADPSSQFVTDGKALEAEAVDTLALLNKFNNSPAVLEVRVYGDLREQQRVNNALEVIRQARSRADSALVDVRSTLATVGTREPALEDATNSAGQIVGEDALGKKEDATVQNPETETEDGQQAVETTSNADETTTRQVGAFQDDGINALSEDSGRIAPTIPTATSGVDGISVNRGYNQEIKPRENLLKKFGSSTYNATLYMLRPEEYNKMMGYGDEANAGPDADAQAVKSVEGLNAILSSGGMPASYDPYSFGGAIRNPNFDLDYFIDDIQIDTLMPQQVRGASNVTQLSFKITEPYGFTFLTRLKKASQELIGRYEGNDWIRQHYLMVIRFYGQEDGATSQDDNIAVEGGVDNGQINVVTQAPLSEKYIPFKFTNITTRASTGAVEYMCQAVPINHLEAMSQKRATIKYQVEIQGQTLENLFNGKLSQEIDGNESRLLSTGLVESINKYYKELQKKGVIGIADEFEVKFRGDIGKQRISPPGSTKKNRTAMANYVNPALLSATSNSVQKNRLSFSVNAGMQFQQFIDQAVRSSEWITKQQKKFIDPNTRDVKDKSSNNLLQWYRITSSVKQLGYDELRKDYAYKVIYNVIPSAVGDVKSSFFPKKKFNGCQKRYKYWFTGENTEILNYEVDFNALYYVSTSPDAKPDTTDIGTVGEITSPGPADQSIQGGADLSAEPAARAASVLYSPVDYGVLNLNILGDPFYIQQGDIFWRSFGVDDTNPGYLADGSADFDSGEVLLEVDYNTIEDYDEGKGIAPVRPIELKPPSEVRNTTTESGEIYKGLIYQVTQVTNKFDKGIFTQDIQGVLRQYLSPTEDLRADPEVRPTNSVTLSGPTGSVTYNGPTGANNIQGTVIPPLLVSQSSTSTTQAAPRTAFGSNQAPIYVAPDDDAS